MLNLDTFDGRKVAQKYLDTLSQVMENLGLKSVSRSYKEQFTNSYQQMLHTFYTVDILDSA